MLKKISSYIIVLAIGAVMGSYFNNKKAIEEKIVYKDRVNTVVKEVIKQTPDGTIITERETTKNEARDSVATKKTILPQNKDWGVSVKYDLFRPVPVWTAEIHRRIIGNIYAGAYGRTDGIVGVSATIFF
jgi:hypothetical protein